MDQRKITSPASAQKGMGDHHPTFTPAARRLIMALAVVAIAALAAGTYMMNALWGTYCSDEEQVIYIFPDDKPGNVRQKVESLAHGSQLKMFHLLAMKKDYYDHIRPGRYDLGSGNSTLQVFRNLRSGNETPVRITIPPLHNAKELARLLGKKLMADSTEFASALGDSALLAKFGLKRETAVCLFLQNTYEVYWTTTGEKLLERMAKEYDHFWTKERMTKLENAQLTREQAITLASIVEGETANNAEKPTIAGLYLNRLHKGIKLQADPTVKFAVGDFTIRRVLLRHLETDSPYNTYRNEGLPPGPICIPSPVSVDAVLNYEHHDYIYMCAKEDFSGTHNFAVTAQEHAANARRFQQALDARGIKK